MIEHMDGVRIAYEGTGVDMANAVRPIIRRMIAGVDVVSVKVDRSVTYRLERGLDILVFAGHGDATLLELTNRHARAIGADIARRSRHHVIDRNDARVALAHGGERMMRQLARTATRHPRIHAWKNGESSFAPGMVELQETDQRRMRLENGRISSYVQHGEQTWAHGSLLIGKDVQLPASIVNAIAGRRLDDIASGSMLAGHGLTIRKAWNVGRSLGMTFKADIIDIHEALTMCAPLRRAA